MGRRDQGHLHPSIKHPGTEMSWPGLEPPQALYQRAIATDNAVYYLEPLQFE
jgi:hypothetical protein